MERTRSPPLPRLIAVVFGRRGPPNEGRDLFRAACLGGYASGETVASLFGQPSRWAAIRDHRLTMNDSPRELCLAGHESSEREVELSIEELDDASEGDLAEADRARERVGYGALIGTAY